MVALRSLLLSAAGLLVFAPGADAAPQGETRADRARERAARAFDRALEAREEAYAALVAEHSGCESWLLDAAADPGEPPVPVQAWFDEMSLPQEEYGAQRERTRTGQPFHELWNRDLYRHSPAARGYARAASELEEAFLDLEKARHPERFARGFEDTPDGMTLIAGDRYGLGPSTGYLLGYPEMQRERQVRVRPFYLDKREVTCADYARFLLAQPASLREEHLPAAWGRSADGDPVYPEGQARHPVAGVAWTSAAHYAEWIGKRLPTEAEWEAAAAGTGRRRYPLGDRFDVSKVNCRAYGANGPRTANEFPDDVTPQGVLGMTGNVREWTADLYEERPGREKASPARRPGPYTMAAVRGGSFRDEADACTSVFRWMAPALESRQAHVGFRCAMDVR